MRNISLKLFLIWTGCSGGDVRYFLSIALVAFCSVFPNHLCNYGSGPYVEHFCETVLSLEQWFKRKRCLKTFLSRGLVDPLISRLEQFVQF